MTVMVDPTWQQANFRGKVDDSTNANSTTWIAATSINWTQAVDSTFRVRFAISEVAGANQNNTPTFKLKYSLNGGAYTDVAAQGATTDAVRYANGQPADNDTTSQQVSAGTFEVGRYAEQSTHTALGAMSNEVTDMEWALELYSGQVINGNTIGLRVYLTSDVAFSNYINTPSLTVSEALSLVADPGSYTLTGTAASLEWGRVVACDAGAYTLTGTAATLSKGFTLAADPGSYSLTGTAAGLTAQKLIACDAGAYTLTGTATSLEQGYALAAAAGSYTLSGQEVTLTYSGGGTPRTVAQFTQNRFGIPLMPFGSFERGEAIVLTAEAGSYTLTGTAADLLYGRTVVCDVGSYSLTGTDASLNYGNVLSCDSGSYAITGTDASLEVGRVVSADAGSYSLTGTAAAFLLGRVLACDAGSYTLTGTAADLSHQQGLTLAAQAGSYALSGTAADLRYARVFSCDPGSYTLTGTDASLNKGQTLGADPGSYALTGTAVELLWSRRLSADSGAYTLTGVDAGLSRGVTMTADIGSYSVTGTAIELKLGRVLSANVGSYVLTGGTATFDIPSQPTLVHRWSEVLTLNIYQPTLSLPVEENA